MDQILAGKDIQIKLPTPKEAPKPVKSFIELKSIANTSYNSKNYINAISLYSDILSIYCSEQEIPTILINRSLCYSKLDNHNLAIKDLKEALNHPSITSNSKNKALFRSSISYTALSEFKQAIDSLDLISDLNNVGITRREFLKTRFNLVSRIETNCTLDIESTIKSVKESGRLEDLVLDSNCSRLFRNLDGCNRLEQSINACDLYSRLLEIDESFVIELVDCFKKSNEKHLFMKFLVYEYFREHLYDHLFDLSNVECSHFQLIFSSKELFLWSVKCKFDIKTFDNETLVKLNNVFCKVTGDLGWLINDACDLIGNGNDDILLTIISNSLVVSSCTIDCKKFTKLVECLWKYARNKHSLSIKSLQILSKLSSIDKQAVASIVNASDVINLLYRHQNDSVYNSIVCLLNNILQTSSRFNPPLEFHEHMLETLESTKSEQLIGNYSLTISSLVKLQSISYNHAKSLMYLLIECSKISKLKQVKSNIGIAISNLVLQFEDLRLILREDRNLELLYCAAKAE